MEKTLLTIFETGLTPGLAFTLSQMLIVLFVIMSGLPDSWWSLELKRLMNTSLFLSFTTTVNRSIKSLIKKRNNHD